MCFFQNKALADIEKMGYQESTWSEICLFQNKTLAEIEKMGYQASIWSEKKSTDKVGQQIYL